MNQDNEHKLNLIFFLFFWTLEIEVCDSAKPVYSTYVLG